MMFSSLRTSRASLTIPACASLVALAVLLIPAAPQTFAQFVARPGHHHPSPLPSLHPATKSVANPPTVATAEGTWTPLVNQVPETVGLMMLLTDGTVVASGNNGNLGTGGDNTWYKLTPDSKGSYVNGTWSQLTSMQYARLYVLSQILQNGKVFIAGGEYGNSPDASSELYDPIANTWTELPSAATIDSDMKWVDGESMLMPNGNILAYAVEGTNCTNNILGQPSGAMLIYNVPGNSYSAAACAIGFMDETSWIKLPDNSILALDLDTTTSERYFPSTNTWVADAVPPVYLFNAGGELGGAFLLPNGNVFYIGGTNQTLIYTPSGNSTPGTWTQGPTLPDEGGAPVGANDAPAAEMVNGKILMTEGGYVNPPCDYCAPTYFFVYDYQTNTISSINSPDGTASDGNTAPFQADMLDLPDGSVLYEGNSTQLYTFKPATPQIQAGEPVITSVHPNSDGSYLLTGTGFNGISSGADYGDENQNATNYPIASLTDNSGNVYFARTYNWSSTGVSTGSKVVTTNMSLPAGLPHGPYTLTVSANGISSDPSQAASAFCYFCQQTITFNQPSNVNAGSPPVTLSATASSGLPVSFASLTPTVCTVSGSKATILAVGTCTIRATQAGNGTYAAATPVNRSFSVLASSSGVEIDAKTSFDQNTAKSSVTSPAFTTSTTNELILAFVSTDSVALPNTTVLSVSGGGLNWTLVKRTNAQRGTSEIWRAFATGVVSNATVTANLSQKVVSSITVASFKGVNTSGINGSGAIGSTASGNGGQSAPSATLVTAKANSLLIGVGNDYDKAIARTPVSGQSIVHQSLSSSADTYWVQMVNAPVPLRGTTVVVRDSAPTTDRYNLAICEIVAAGVN